MDYKLADLIDIPKLQELMDAFYTVTATPSAILDADGTVLTATAWQDICTKYHRVNADSLLRCQQSDAYIATHLGNGCKYALYECGNGLVDVASPIMVNGEHLGTVFTGQFLLQEPDTDFFRRQSQALGFDEAGYMQALAQVPIVQREKIEPTLNYLALFASMLAEMGIQRMQQLEAQHRVRESEERFRMAQFALDNVSDGVHWLNKEGRHIYVNQAMCHYLGYTSDELLTMTLDQVDPGVELEQWRRETWPLIQEHGSVTFEALHRRKDGSLVPVEITGNYMQFEGQEYLCAFARDISERKRQEEELRTFKALVDNALDGVAMAGLDARLTYINPAFQAMSGLGAQAEDIYVPDLYPAETRLSLEQEVIPAVMNQGVWQGVLEMNRPDGSRWLAQHSAFAIRNEDGQVIKMANVLRDVTEQQRAEAELRNFQTVVENSPDGVSIVSPDGIITYGNPAMKAMMGYGEDYINSAVSLVFGGNADIPMQIIQHVIEHGTWQGLQTYYRKDGSTVQVHVSVFAIKDAEGNILAFPGIVRDMTDLQRAEAERAALQQQVIDAQRDALRELSTPLIPISEHVVIMPLIGSIDSGRAQMVMESLLDGVAQHRAELAIIDITGVSVVDTQVAQALVSAAQAVKLLGAQVMLTGIQPQIAQTLVHLGVDLSSIVTRGSLQSGIAAALQGSNEHRNGV